MISSVKVSFRFFCSSNCFIKNQILKVNCNGQYLIITSPTSQKWSTSLFRASILRLWLMESIDVEKMSWPWQLRSQFFHRVVRSSNMKYKAVDDYASRPQHLSILILSAHIGLKEVLWIESFSASHRRRNSLEQGLLCQLVPWFQNAPRDHIFQSMHCLRKPSVRKDLGFEQTGTLHVLLLPSQQCAVLT